MRLLAIWLLALCGLQLARSADQIAGGAVGFDLLLLVRQYSPSLCARERCTAAPIAEFTLHGLWPEYRDGGWPQYCGGGGGGAAPEAAPAMDCQWPSFHGTNQGFWTHEWEKHGTCAAPLLGDRAAFMAAALQAHERHDINAALAAASIEPSDSAAYASGAVTDALKAAFGAAPLLSCAQGAIVEIWSCLDLDLHMVECPPRVGPSRRCSEEVRLPQGGAVGPSCAPFFPRWPSSRRRHRQRWVWAGAAAAAAALAAGVSVWAVLALRRRRETAGAQYTSLPS